MKQVESSRDVDNLLSGLGLVRVWELDDFITRWKELGDACPEKKSFQKINLDWSEVIMLTQMKRKHIGPNREIFF